MFNGYVSERGTVDGKSPQAALPSSGNDPSRPNGIGMAVTVLKLAISTIYAALQGTKGDKSGHTTRKSSYILTGYRFSIAGSERRLEDRLRS